MRDTYQPLSIYSSQEYQLRVTQGLINHNVIPTMYMSRTHLLPFIVHRLKPGDDISEQNTIVHFTIIEVQNIHNNKTYDILENLAFQFGVRADNDLVNQYHDYALYRGESTIPALPQGVYQLYLKDDNDNEFYSEIFKIFFPQYTVKFEFNNSKDINDLWFFENLYYTFEFEAITYSTAEFDELLSVIVDKWDHNVKTKQRKDEIMGVDIFADTRILRAFHALEFCDTVYITNETGQRNLVEITEITPNQSTRGGHAEFTVKYRIIENMLTSERKLITYIGADDGTDPVIHQKGLFIGGKKLKIGNKKLIP